MSDLEARGRQCFRGRLSGAFGEAARFKAQPFTANPRLKKTPPPSSA
jgi:hypothetical protein